MTAAQLKRYDAGMYSGGSRICKRGAKVEHRRREYRGAEGAEWMGCGEGVSPYPLGEGSGKGAVPPPQKKIVDFRSKNVDF